MKILRWMGYGCFCSTLMIGAFLPFAPPAWIGAEAESEPVSKPPPPPMRVFCFGYVDVETGVVELLPTQTGRIVEIPIKENTRVEKGDVLLRLDEEPARLEVQEARAAVGTAEAQLEQVRPVPAQHAARLAAQRAVVASCEEALKPVQEEYDRKLALQRRQVYSQKHLDDIEGRVRQLEAKRKSQEERLRELELANPQAEVRLAEEQLKMAEARLAKAEYALGECRLCAPQDGLVLRVLAGVGDIWGQMSREPALIFCPAAPRMVRAEVEQEFAAGLQPGQRARLQDDANPDTTWRGTVIRISDWYTRRREIRPEAVRYQDVRTVECLVELEEDQPPLRIGQRMQVLIETAPE